MLSGQDGSLVVEVVESPERLLDQAVGVQVRQADEGAGHAGSITAPEIIGDCAAVFIDEGNDWEGHSRAEKAELLAEVLEEDALAEVIKLLNDVLNGEVVALREFPGLFGDEDRWVQGFVEPEQCGVDRPGIEGIEASEVDQDDRPPFFDVEHSRKVGTERLQESDLPIEMVWKFLEQSGDHHPAVWQG
jgi:hypothetical protein